ncbi:MAG: phosphatidylserine decarboxylase family protein [Bacteroidia bacterium]|nr:phosphatidylserine decarboxylase family protein [Bacteroidia bacterium]
MIHREGRPTIILSVLFCSLILFAAFYFAPEIHWLHVVCILLSLFIMVTVLQFFRNPTRNWRKNEDFIISPADGKVVVIEETSETEYFKDRRIQISVFMSPVNVHVNRNPVSGTVKLAKYHPGLYLVAWHPKSSTENERTTLVIAHPKGQILFRQIAGAMARRICQYLREGQEVKQSEEMGFIKFGSRVDVFIPLNARIKVKLGETVRGGITTLAEW